MNICIHAYELHGPRFTQTDLSERQHCALSYTVMSLSNLFSALLHFPEC